MATEREILKERSIGQSKEKPFNVEMMHIDSVSISSIQEETNINNKPVQESNQFPITISMSNTRLQPINVMVDHPNKEDDHISDSLCGHAEAWSTGANRGDVVCLGATFIIVVLQLCVLVFYIFKDHERDETQHDLSR